MNISMDTTEDGFAYAAFQQSNKAMETFLARAVEENLGLDAQDVHGFSSSVYWEWGQGPVPGLTLEKTLAQVKAHAK